MTQGIKGIDEVVDRIRYDLNDCKYNSYKGKDKIVTFNWYIHIGKHINCGRWEMIDVFERLTYDYTLRRLIGFR